MIGRMSRLKLTRSGSAAARALAAQKQPAATRRTRRIEQLIRESSRTWRPFARLETIPPAVPPQTPGSVIKRTVPGLVGSACFGPRGAANAPERSPSFKRGPHEARTRTVAAVRAVRLRAGPGCPGTGTGHDRHVLRDGD